MAFERDRDEIAQANAELRRNQMLDNELQPDPELAEGPASGGRIALFAIAVVAILGVVFYGLNSSTPTNNSASNPPAQTTATNSGTPATNTGTPATPPAPVNPNANPGQTTGAAPPAPTTPPTAVVPGNSPASAPNGSGAPAGASSGQ